MFPHGVSISLSAQMCCCVLPISKQDLTGRKGITVLCRALTDEAELAVQ